jgi:hypothetical protein
MAAPPGDKVYKNELIAKFASDVVDGIVGQVEKDRSDVPTQAGSPPVTGISSADSASLPFVRRDDLRVKPTDFSSQTGVDAGGFANNQSTVVSRSGHINAAALADLFMIYGRNLTAVRRCSFNINKVTTSSGGSTTATPVTVACTPAMASLGYCTMPGDYTYYTYTTGAAGSSSTSVAFSWSNQITALSSRYAMSAAAFKSAVESGTNPFDNLKVGEVFAGSALTDLITKIYNVVNANISSSAGTISITTCHSSCHSSCHGSRGRR